MIISIVTGGSRGDVQPYIALGKGLHQEGYDIRIIASDDFEHLTTEAGLTFCSMGYSVEQILQSDEWRQINEQGNFLTILSQMQKEMKQQAKMLASKMPDLVQGSDLLVTGVGGFGGAFSIADMLNIPIIQAYVFPITPTSAYASPLTPTLPFGKLLNPLSFHAMRQMLWQSTRIGDVETRRLLGLPKGSFWGPFQKLNTQRVPILYGYSKHIVPHPGDWDSHHHITGYWFLDEALDWTPPSELLDFLNAGEPPIYIGFGSMLNKNPQEVAETVLEALSISGQRGVLASGWGGMSQTDLPDNVHMISSIPHSWLFPKMAAVVHHGGAGTTAAGLRAGIPSIIVPFMGDQAFWGQQLAKMGVGTDPIPRKKLTAKRLAEAINQTVSDTTMQRMSTRLGKVVREEDGVANAVSIINSLAGETITSKVIAKK